MKSVTFTRVAIKALRSIPARQRDLILSKVGQLAADPESLAANVKQLQGRPEMRLRVGDYRVIYTEALEVLNVVNVGHRSTVYD